MDPTGFAQLLLRRNLFVVQIAGLRRECRLACIGLIHPVASRLELSFYFRILVKQRCGVPLHRLSTFFQLRQAGSAIDQQLARTLEARTHLAYLGFQATNVMLTGDYALPAFGVTRDTQPVLPQPDPVFGNDRQAVVKGIPQRQRIAQRRGDFDT